MKSIQIKGLSKQEALIVDYLQNDKEITTSKAEEVLGVKPRRAREILKKLTEKVNGATVLYGSESELRQPSIMIFQRKRSLVIKT